MTDIVAIIPARSGSKSVIDKNITLLSGHPLIAYSIAIAKLSNKIGRVIVSTNSVEYSIIAQIYGAEVPFLRPEEFSSDDATDRDFLIHAMNFLNVSEKLLPEYWVHLRPTTPLREIAIIDDAIDCLLNDSTSTSLRSGHKAPESPLKWFMKDEDGYFKGLMDSDVEDEVYNLPKEAFDDVYIPDGYIDILKASHVMNKKTVHGNKIMGFESPVCTEVDSKDELYYIQYQIEKNGSQLLDYLDKCVSKEV